MMESGKWRARNSLWLFLALFPVLDSAAFLYIGNRLKRRSYTAVGAATAFLWFALFTFLAFSTEFYFSTYRLENYIYIILLGLLLWPLLAIYALAQRTPYLKRLAARARVLPARPEILSDAAWRRRSSLWLAWAILPGLGGLSLLHIGLRAKKRLWIVLGAVLQLALFVCMSSWLSIRVRCLISELVFGDTSYIYGGEFYFAVNSIYFYILVFIFSRCLSR